MPVSVSSLSSDASREILNDLLGAVNRFLAPDGLSAASCILVDAHDAKPLENPLGLAEEAATFGQRLILLSSEPPLASWAADGRLMQNLLYMHMLHWYGLADRVPYGDLAVHLSVLISTSDATDLTKAYGQMQQDVINALSACKQALSLLLVGDGGKGLTFLIGAFKTLFDKAAIPQWIKSNRTNVHSFLKDIAAIYQAGSHLDGDKEAADKVPWLTAESRFNAHTLVREEDVGLAELAKGHLDGRKHFTALRVYEVLRDFARCMAVGAPERLRKLPKPLKILLIDDNPAKVQKQLAYLKPLLGEEPVLGLLKNPRVWKTLTSLLDVNLARTDSDTESFLPDFLWGNQSVQAKFPDYLWDYDAILVDIDFGGHSLGPSIVRQLSTFFDLRLENSGQQTPRPRIIALSLSQHPEHIQQALNQGADTYIFKRRIYSLPSRLAELLHSQTSSEPSSRKANFRSLFRLPPRVINSLHRSDSKALIRGNPENPRERSFIDRIPKADLHHHIGTCISLPIIQVLALNTIGYLLDSSGTEYVQQFGEEVARLVVLTAAFLSDSEPKCSKSVLGAIWNACCVLRRDWSNCDRPPTHGVLEKVIDGLVPENTRVARFEVTALLVSALLLFDSNACDPPAALLVLETPLSDARVYFEELASLGNDPKLAAKELLEGLKREVSQFLSSLALCQWTRAYTADAVRQPFQEPAFTVGDIFKKIDDSLEKRLKKAATWLASILKDQLDNKAAWIEDKQNALLAAGCGPVSQRLNTAGSAARGSAPLNLFQNIVQASEILGSERSLLRYLEGAALLGADHLQYPENLLLAAEDLVQQAVQQNIVYSEVRCATTGYAEGGMTPVSATELLRYSFDLAVLSKYLGGHDPRRRLVMFNILLAAKRHKDEAEVREVIALLGHYLQRRNECPAEDLAAAGIPGWWKPCRVVGFDLSGDEAVQAEKFSEHVQPLFKECAFITVHAGEVASAESIWQAVYRLGARRIGHGLRLREHRRLMEYCITEGICLELCPISNNLTNIFKPLPEDRKSWLSGKRDYYPLRYYMENCLEVCLNTDNRFLHSEYTLTGEYLKAAEMAGGLTKWEILQLAKAGFKHAFLAKNEVERLLHRADEEVFRIAQELDQEV